MQSLPSPLREPSHGVPFRAAPVNSGSHTHTHPRPVQRVRTRTPGPGRVYTRSGRALRFQPACRGAPRRLPAWELPISEPRARLRRKPSTCSVPIALMTPAEGEGSPSRVWPGVGGGPGLGGHRSDSHLSSARIGGAAAAAAEVALCNWSRESESGAGRQGRVSVWEGGREGGTEGGNEGEGGVSHGRAPSRARLESRWL